MMVPMIISTLTMTLMTFNDGYYDESIVNADNNDDGDADGEVCNAQPKRVHLSN